MEKSVFLDRDGVINYLVERDGGLFSPRCFSEFRIKPDARAAINIAKKLGYLCIVVSNQPDITRGKMCIDELNKMDELMLQELKLDGIIYCTHDDSNDIGCRKPAPGMFYQAQKKWNIDLRASYMIGDGWRDIAAANEAKVKSIIISDNYNLDVAAAMRTGDLLEAMEYVRKQDAQKLQGISL